MKAGFGQEEEVPGSSLVKGRETVQGRRGDPLAFKVVRSQRESHSTTAICRTKVPEVWVVKDVTWTA